MEEGVERGRERGREKGKERGRECVKLDECGQRKGARKRK